MPRLYDKDTWFNFEFVKNNYKLFTTLKRFNTCCNNSQKYLLRIRLKIDIHNVQKHIALVRETKQK